MRLSPQAGDKRFVLQEVVEERVLQVTQAAKQRVWACSSCTDQSYKCSNMTVQMHDAALFYQNVELLRCAHESL